MYSNPHRHALGEPDPRENRTDGRKALVVCLCVWDIDAPCDAADLALNDPAVPQQFDLRWIAFMNGGKLRFLKIGIHPKGIGIDEGDHAPPYRGIVTELHCEVGNPTVHGRTDFGALQIYLCLMTLRGRLVDTRLSAAELGFERRDLTLGKGKGRLCILECRLSLTECRRSLLLHLYGSRLALCEILVPSRLLYRKCQRCVLLLHLGLVGTDLRLLHRDLTRNVLRVGSGLTHCCLRQLQCDLVVGWIDHQQQLTLMG